MRTQESEKTVDIFHFWPISLTVSCLQLNFKMPSFTFIYLEISVMQGTPEINQKALKNDSVKVDEYSASVLLAASKQTQWVALVLISWRQLQS